MKSTFKIILGLVIALSSLHCGSTGDSNNQDFNENNNLDAITLYQIETDPALNDLSFSRVEIPAGLFGDTLDGATFSITKNEFSALTGLVASDYIVEALGENGQVEEIPLVAFNMYNINAGDTVTFNLFFENEGVVIYSGEFSDTENTLATLQGEVIFQENENDSDDGITPAGITEFLGLTVEQEIFILPIE